MTGNHFYFFYHFSHTIKTPFVKILIIKSFNRINNIKMYKIIKKLFAKHSNILFNILLNKYPFKTITDNIFSFKDFLFNFLFFLNFLLYLFSKVKRILSASTDFFSQYSSREITNIFLDILSVSGRFINRTTFFLNDIHL